MTVHKLTSRNPGLRPLPSNDAHFLEYARRWAPFGGPSNEEIFVRFGMSRPRYNRAVWEFLAHNGIDLQAESVEVYAAAYPSPLAHAYAAQDPRPTA